MKDWSKEQPLAGFAYDYLCDLVHPNKGSNLIIIVERNEGPMFDVEGQKSLGLIVFDKIFGVFAKLCADEFGKLFIILALLGADEDKIKMPP